MNELTVFQHDAVDVVDSRQVAEMIGRRHDHLIRDIKSYCDILSKTTDPKIGGSTERNFAPSDFFIDSSYKDSTGRTLPCYLLTKKGCDMVANKMTGEKGVLFTAAYVTAFEAMRQHIQSDGVTIRDSIKQAETERRLQIMEKNAEARLMAEKTKQARLYTSTWAAAGIAPQYQALTLNGFIDGLSLPREAFQDVCTHPLDATAIADHLGILSASGKPHNQAVAALIGELELDESEQTLTPYSRNGHDGASMQYAPSVEDKVRAWLDSHGWPSPLPAGGKKYAVRYRK